MRHRISDALSQRTDDTDDTIIIRSYCGSFVLLFIRERKWQFSMAHSFHSRQIRIVTCASEIDVVQMHEKFILHFVWNDFFFLFISKWSIHILSLSTSFAVNGNSNEDRDRQKIDLFSLSVHGNVHANAFHCCHQRWWRRQTANSLNAWFIRMGFCPLWPNYNSKRKKKRMCLRNIDTFECRTNWKLNWSDDRCLSHTVEVWANLTS